MVVPGDTPLPIPKVEIYTIAGPQTMPYPRIEAPFMIVAIQVTNNSIQQLYLNPTQPVSSASEAVQTVEPRMIYGFNGWLNRYIYLNSPGNLALGEYITITVVNTPFPSPAALMISSPLPPAVPASDTMPNPQATSTLAFGMLYDQTTGLWERAHAADPLGAIVNIGVQEVALGLWDSALNRFVTWGGASGDAYSTTTRLGFVSPGVLNSSGAADRMRSANSDSQAGIGIASSGGMLWNAQTGWDLMRRASQTNIGTFQSIGTTLVTEPGHWIMTANPGTGVRASSTRAAVAGARHILRFLVSHLEAASLPGVVGSPIEVRDGTSGVGTILFQRNNLVENVAGSRDELSISGISLVGSINTPMTVEFAVAVPNCLQSFTAGGYDAL